MSLIVSGKKRSSFPPIEAGPHLGRCVQLIDLGKQKTSYSGQEKIVEQVMLVFEFPFDTVEIDGEDKPRTMSLTYTGGESGLAERANLRKMLESWRGKAFTDDELAGFDLRNVVNKTCTLTTTQKTNAEGNVYAVITGVTLPMRGTVVPPAETPVYCFDFDDADWEAAFAALPEWQQKRIEAGLTYAEKKAAAKGTTTDTNGFEELGNPDDLPF